MPYPTTVREKWVFEDEVTFGAPVGLPPACVGNDQIDPSTIIETDKTEQRYCIRYDVDPLTTIASATKLLHLTVGAGEVVAMVARVVTAPVGGDKQFTIDIQTAADASNVWTSVLGSVLTFANGDADHTLKLGTINGTLAGLDPGDAVRIVITASGSTGTQGIGLIVEVYCDHVPF